MTDKVVDLVEWLRETDLTSLRDKLDLEQVDFLRLFELVRESGPLAAVSAGDEGFFQLGIDPSWSPRAHGSFRLQESGATFAVELWQGTSRVGEVLRLHASDARLLLALGLSLDLRVLSEHDEWLVGVSLREPVD